MGLVAKIVNQQQNQPHALLQAGQEASRELLKAESLRVAGTEASNRSRKIRDQEERQGGGQEQQAAGKKSAEQDAAEQNPFDNNESGPSGANPWAGNIVNVKI